MYIWELEDWQGRNGPSFHWQPEVLQPRLDEVAARRAHLIAQHESLSGSQEDRASNEELDAAQVDALIASALRSSEIEGEHLDVASLRFSVITQLGLDKAGFPNQRKHGNQHTDSLVQLLLEATIQISTPLSTDILCQWQASLFTDSSLGETLRIGRLRGDDLMQLVSGRIDRPTVHFEAPPGNRLDITPWLSWFLDVLSDAMLQGQQRFERVIRKARFWRLHAQTVLSERQVKILNRMLDGWGVEFVDGINASKYGSLGRVSKATSTRELAGLVGKGCLHKLAVGGRSIRYALCAATHSCDQ